MNKVKMFVKDNKVEIITTFFCALYFFIQILGVGIATHDELLNIYKVRVGIFAKYIHWDRWGVDAMNALPSYIHASSNSMIVYRMWTMFGVVASCIAFTILLCKITNKKISWLFLFLFFTLAQIETDHDGFFSFCFAYQLNTCYVFLGLVLYSDYLKNHRKSYWILSAICYLLSAMAYEAFLVYGVLFFLLILAQQMEEKKINILAIIRELWLHAALVFGYAAMYLIRQSKAPVSNGDTAINASLKPAEFFVTMWKMATGLFPLSYRRYSVSDFFRRSFTISNENLFRLLLVFAMCMVICKVVVETEKIEIRKYLKVTVFCFVGMLLPGCLIATTEKFVQWVYYNGVRSFGVSYYSYFFIIAWIAISIVVGYQLVPLKKIYLGLIFVLVFFVTEFTAINNERFIDNFAQNQNKYELWENFVTTDYFAKMDSGAQLYIPEYMGIHHDMNLLADYANGIAGTQISAVNDLEMMDFGRPVYYLDWDVDNELYYVSKIDTDWVTDEVYVYSLSNLDGYGIIVDRDNRQGVATLSVNGEVINSYGTEVITGVVSKSDRDLVIDCKGMLANTFELYKPAGSYDNSLLHTSGIYGQEGWGRWAQKECSIKYDNADNAVDIVELQLSILTPAQEESNIVISCGEFVQTCDLTGTTDLSIQIPVKEGENVISMVSSAPDIVVDTGDTRAMNMRVYEMTLKIGENEFKINNP